MFRKAAAVGCVLAALAVMLGAFGSHVLKGQLSQDDLATFQTGVHYHMFHAIAIIVAAIVAGSSERAGKAVWAYRFFVAGIVLFSGSLYVLVIADIRQLGAVAPLGGTSFIIGWLLLALACLKRR